MLVLLLLLLLKTALLDICDVDTVIIECEVTANEISNQIKSNLILSELAGIWENNDNIEQQSKNHVTKIQKGY